MWLSYHCLSAKENERAFVFGNFGFANQLGAPSTLANVASESSWTSGWIGSGRNGVATRLPAEEQRQTTASQFAPDVFSRRRIFRAEITQRFSPARVQHEGRETLTLLTSTDKSKMYLARHPGRWSTRVIVRFYNGRDHSTVCYSVKKSRRCARAIPRSMLRSPNPRTRRVV